MAFLDALRRTGPVQGAADEAGVERSTPYKYRIRNPDFAEAWEKALRQRAEAGDSSERGDTSTPGNIFGLISGGTRLPSPPPPRI